MTRAWIAIAAVLGCTPVMPEEPEKPEPVAPVRTPVAVASTVQLDTPPSVELEQIAGGARLRIDPPGIQVDIPVQIAGEAYVGDDLKHVEACSGHEWDPEFAAVTAAVLPFERLVAHLGSEPFCGGVSYHDPHVRVYVLDDGVDAVARSIARRGEAAIRDITGAAQPPAEPVQAKWASAPPSEWTRVELRYDRFYIDYGARAFVEAFMQRFGTKTIAIVFWRTVPLTYWADDERVDPQADLLRSVRTTS